MVYAAIGVDSAVGGGAAIDSGRGSDGEINGGDRMGGYERSNSGIFDDDFDAIDIFDCFRIDRRDWDVRGAAFVGLVRRRFGEAPSSSNLFQRK